MQCNWLKSNILGHCLATELEDAMDMLHTINYECTRAKHKQTIILNVYFVSKVNKEKPDQAPHISGGELYTTKMDKMKYPAKCTTEELQRRLAQYKARRDGGSEKRQARLIRNKKGANTG